MSVSIVALQGAASFVVQSRLARFVADRRRDGLRVCGCIEAIVEPDRSGCGGRYLVDLATGRRYPIGQNLGPGSIACKLDSTGVASACVDALESIRNGCDLVVLAKFGKLEARRSGLIDAFAEAVTFGVPIVTSVAPKFAGHWRAYAGDLAQYLPPDTVALDEWWKVQTSGVAVKLTATA